MEVPPVGADGYEDTNDDGLDGGGLVHNALSGVFRGSLHFQEGFAVHHAATVEAVYEHEAVAQHDTGVKMGGPVAAADLEAQAAPHEHVDAGEADGQAASGLNDIDQVAVVGVVVVGAIALQPFSLKRKRARVSSSMVPPEAEFIGETVEEWSECGSYPIPF